jgi:hypothetical protein
MNEKVAFEICINFGKINFDDGLERLLIFIIVSLFQIFDGNVIFLWSIQLISDVLRKSHEGSKIL